VGQQVLDQLAIKHPSVSAARVDGSYNNAVVNRGAP
jgi:hypothetical protein